MQTRVWSAIGAICALIMFWPIPGVLADTARLAASSGDKPHRNIILFVADGLRRGSVTAADAPTLLALRARGVDFPNSHALFPTLTTPNAATIATGHLLGDTGDFANFISGSYRIFEGGQIAGKKTGTPTPFLENNQVLADLNQHFKGGNYLDEESFLAVARQHGYHTASIGKLGPVGIQDVTQLSPEAGFIPLRETVFIDDSTGTPGVGIPLAQPVQAALSAAGLALIPPRRDQPAGDVRTPGAHQANVVQQQYFADALTKAVLPLFNTAGGAFAAVFWCRDPDGTQHNQGDSLNRVVPGINGPTSRAAITNVDNNLHQVLAYLDANPVVAANTDVFVTSDHGFATISKHEIDASGQVSNAYASKFTYLGMANKTDEPTVVPGWLPPGFLAIDIAHALALPLFDPDATVTVGGIDRYIAIEPDQPNTATHRQRPAAGNGLVGGTGIDNGKTDAQVIVAANGGIDLVYLPDGNADRLRSLAVFLLRQDYIGGLFVDEQLAIIPGTLPLQAIGLAGTALMPRPAMVVNFKTFASDPGAPQQTAVQISDTVLQEGQGMHGAFSRANTLNNMAAFGPDFKQGFIDETPVSNADIAQTIFHVMGLTPRNTGRLRGRVLREALVGGPSRLSFKRRHRTSAITRDSGRATRLEYQQVGDHVYFDEARLVKRGMATVGRDEAARR